MDYGKAGKTEAEGHASQGEKRRQLALQEKWDETKDDEKEVLKV